MYYAKSTRGFYNAAIHGSRKLSIVDPAWACPTIAVPDPDWIAADHPDEDAPMIEVPDPDAVPDTIEIDNPACKIPADAVEITAEQHAALMAEQAQGQVIRADAEGNPVAVDPRSIMSLAELQAAQIDIIEAGYQDAIQQPVSYMGTTFQADIDSQDVLTKSLAPGAVPSGFFWLDAGNNAVPMTYADLQGLAGAMLAQGQAAFAKKTGLKQQIRAAASAAEVEAVLWD